MKRLVLGALLVTVVLAASAAWALDEGQPAPPLTLRPVNAGDGEQNIIGGLEGTVIVAFINGTQIKGELTQELSDLIASFNALHEANPEGVYGFMVVVGEYTEEQIKTWTEANHLSVPTALKQPDDAEIAEWSLPGDAAAILYRIDQDDNVGRETKDAGEFDGVFEEAGN